MKFLENNITLASFKIGGLEHLTDKASKTFSKCLIQNKGLQNLDLGPLTSNQYQIYSQAIRHTLKLEKPGKFYSVQAANIKKRNNRSVSKSKDFTNYLSKVDKKLEKLGIRQ
jgi:hypothetical protein